MLVDESLMVQNIKNILQILLIFENLYMLVSACITEVKISPMIKRSFIKYIITPDRHPCDSSDYCLFSENAYYDY